jgi:hypothetical protein
MNVSCSKYLNECSLQQIRKRSHPVAALVLSPLPKDWHLDLLKVHGGCLFQFKVRVATYGFMPFGWI